jgi:hypothetical protein
MCSHWSSKVACFSAFIIFSKQRHSEIREELAKADDAEANNVSIFLQRKAVVSVLQQAVTSKSDYH